MKKTLLIFASVLTISSVGVILTGCVKSNPSDQTEKSAIDHYTCPMHPQIHEDKPGDCPICHMRLVPVYKESSPPSPSPASTQERGAEGGVRISPERQQLIGLKTTTASKGPTTRNIRTVGRVAFDPDLAIAQREFVEIMKNVPSLKEAARSNLRLKGMSEEEITELERAGAKGEMNRASTSLYLPGPKDSIWVYATLYQEEMDLVTPGTKATISLPSGSENQWTGTVRSIDPTVNPMTRSVRARIEIPPGGANIRAPLRPDTYVNVSIQVNLGETLTIPKSSVIDTGTRKIVFVMKEGNRFESREIKTGPEADDQVVVLEGITEGEMVVSSAAFLVDSESRLKAAVTAPSAPTCPEGEYWDMGMAMCMPKVGS